MALDRYTVERAMSKAPKPDNPGNGDDEGDEDPEKEPGDLAAAKTAYKEYVAAVKSGDDKTGFDRLKEIIHYCTK